MSTLTEIFEMHKNDNDILRLMVKSFREAVNASTELVKDIDFIKQNMKLNDDQKRSINRMLNSCAKIATEQETLTTEMEELFRLQELTIKENFSKASNSVVVASDNNRELNAEEIKQIQDWMNVDQLTAIKGYRQKYKTGLREAGKTIEELVKGGSVVAKKLF